MKFTIYCLLAFCAFQAVFADLVKDFLNNFHSQIMQQVQNIAMPFQKEIEHAVDAANKRGINTGNCKDLSNVPFQTFVEMAVRKLQQCNDNVIKTKNISAARKCSNVAISTLKKNLQSIPSIQKCCEACAHKNCKDD